MPKPQQEQLPIVLNGSSPEYTLEISSKVWKLRTSGLSEFDIAVELDLSVPVVRKILDAYRKQYRQEVRKCVKEEMDLDIERCDELLKQFRPIALSTTVQVSRTNSKGEPYTDSEWKYCIQSGQLVLSVLAHRAKLLGYDQPEDNRMIGDHNTLIWLNKGNPAIDQLIQNQPEEVRQSDKIVDVEFEEA